MKDNFSIHHQVLLNVVNCFQKLLSSWWRTTILRFIYSCSVLWIAFKNYYLRDEGQQKYILVKNQGGCELLSKIIIFVMKDNLLKSIPKASVVVNCFQKLLSSWWRTTMPKTWKVLLSLWIAFKNYYLRDEGQQSLRFPEKFVSCELLSKIIIFVMKDNKSAKSTIKEQVVNCFQKLLSSWWRTTILKIR